MKVSENFIARIKAITPWSVPVKLLLSALLGVLGGAGLLGYLSEYATYNYAIHYGIRPPLEGIPYLRPAVGFGSLFLLFSGALVFGLITFVLRSMAWYFDFIPSLVGLLRHLFGRDVTRQEQHYGQVLAKMRVQPLWRLLVGCSVVAILTTAAIVAFHPETKTGGDELKNFNFKIFIFCYIFALTLAVLKPASIWWLSITFTTFYFIACIYLLFSPTKYSEFLRILGYGGGLSVRVELRDTKMTSKSESQTQQLMLRTSEAVILYDKQSEIFIEIPRDQIYRILHNVGGTQRLPLQLPEKINKWGDH